MKKDLLKGCLVLFLLFAVAGVALFVLADYRYGLFFEAPRVSHETVLSFHPSVRILLDPMKAKDVIQILARKYAKQDIPEWLLDLALPFEAALMASADHDQERIHLLGFVNPRRFGPIVTDQLNSSGLLELAPEIDWDDEGFARAQSGVLTLAGSVPMQAEAQEATWFGFDHPPLQKPIPLEGGHLLEAVFDNVDGGAYVAAASLLAAYDIEMNEETESVVLGTIRNAAKVRLTVDLDGTEALLVGLTIEIVPGTRKRLAVANMKGALEDVLEKMVESLEKDHGLTFEGTGGWNEDTLEYNYRLEDPRKLLDLLMAGELY